MIFFCRIHVVKSESDPKLLYGEISNSNKNMRVSCPGPIASICNNFRGNFSWKKDFILLEGNQKDWWIGNSQVDKGVYTCVCTWMHNSEVYQSTGSRKISQERQFVNIKPGILSPEGSKVPAGEEGSVMKLNCTIFCGKNVPTCDAEWKMNGSPIPADGYSNETQSSSRVVNNSMDTFSTAVLTINKVSAKDFQATFTCTGRGLHDSTSKNIKLIWRKTTLDLVMEFLGLLVCCLCVAVLLRCFSIDIILLLRPCLSLAKRKKDTRIYDAYVIYQTKRPDKD
uniref:Ig-like domain-containing protein n=1 Tax=Tetraodon nigroviridis TaxID=99883 RepID=H3DE17_TETNG